MSQRPDTKFIVFFVFSLFGGGAERVVSRLASEWVKDGTRVAIITETDPSTDQYPVDPRVERYSIHSADPGGNPAQKAFNFVNKVLALRTLLKKLGAGTVLSFMCRGNNIAFLATRGTGIKLVVSERNDPVHSKVTRLDALIRPYSYAKSDAIVLQTGTVAKTMKALYTLAPVHVIPNPAPKASNRVLPEVKAARPYILGVGRLAPQKGFDLLISAYAASAAKEKFDLMIVGQGGELEMLKTLARQLGVEEKVIFKGHVPDAAPYYNECAMFVLSSHYEGFPNVLVEAMSAGCPVITFDFPSGANEIVRDGVDGVIVPLGDLPALTRAIDRVAEDGDFRAMLGRNAAPAMERFSVQSVLKLWQAVAGV